MQIVYNVIHPKLTLNISIYAHNLSVCLAVRSALWAYEAAFRYVTLLQPNYKKYLGNTWNYAKVVLQILSRIKQSRILDIVSQILIIG